MESTDLQKRPAPHRTAEILPPGGYLAIPKTVMASKGLTAGAKLLYGALLDLCGPRRRLPIKDRELQEATGQGRTTVIAGRRQLVEAGLIVVSVQRGRIRGRGVSYAFYDPGQALTDPPGKCSDSEHYPPPKCSDSEHFKQTTSLDYRPLEGADGQTTPARPRQEPKREKGRRVATRPPKPKPKPEGAGRRLMGEFCRAFKGRVGEGFAGNRPALATWLRGQAEAVGEVEAARRVGIWFGRDRPDYGWELLKCRWQAAELRKRPPPIDSAQNRRMGEMLATMPDIDYNTAPRQRRAIA